MSKTAQTVMLVDDDLNDAFLIESALRQAQLPLAFTHLTNGQRALDYLQGISPYSAREQYPLPHLVLLDLKLPRKSGFEVLTWIRRQDTFAALPVVILSSSDELSDIQRCKTLGATAYLTKTTDYTNVVEQVRTLLTA